MTKCRMHCLMAVAITLLSNSAVWAEPGRASSGAPGMATPAPYGQTPAPAVFGGPSRSSPASAPLLPALPKAEPAPRMDQGLPQLRQPQPPVQQPKPDKSKP